MPTITIDPITRIEGHLKIEAVVEEGVVKDAHSSGMLFRGFELILEGRDPRDATQITQRVCGVCPIAHATASSLCLDNAFGISDKIPDNGRILRNLILGANYIQSHVLHFYHLAALDYVDVTNAADYDGDDPELKSVSNFLARQHLEPFVPRYEGDYRLGPELDRKAVHDYARALHMRRIAHEMLAVFGGKMPHNCATVVGGCTQRPTADNMAAFLSRLQELRQFIDDVYVPDVLAVAAAYPDYFGIGKGCGRVLAYGVFDAVSQASDARPRECLLPQGAADESLSIGDFDPKQIAEDVKHSWYADEMSGKHPSQEETIPDPDKAAGYSWLKSPRYNGQVYEVGPLARMVVAYLRGMEPVKGIIDNVLGRFKAEPSALFSVLGRHAARAIETKVVADAMVEWITQLKPGEPAWAECEIPDEAEGVGLTDAPRGAVGHWIKISGKRIKRYQLVVPTTWNASPRDDKDQPGPVEQSLIGTPIKDAENPFELVRIVRAYDPCLACSVHLVSPKGRSLAKFRIG